MRRPEDPWTTVRAFMARQCGVVLSEDQDYLLQARLGPVAKQFQMASIDELVEVACRAGNGVPQMTDAVIDAMTTHETSFFRDAGFWRGFEEQIMPALSARRTHGTLRIWSAACSTGQEVYSLLMLIAERFPGWQDRIEVTATDVSAPTVAKAELGIFNTLEVNRGLVATRLLRFFEQVPGGFQAKPSLRSRVRFRVQNLLAADSYGFDYDIVLCRNVLIYFSDTGRAQVIRNLWSSVAPGGYLAVGTTERLEQRSLAPGWYARDTRG
jgi:chemotaxis protein methyltransferase CheR